MRHKCGIYVRVSTEEQVQVVEGSISSQKHRLDAYVDMKNLQEPGWGKVVEIYADEGLSAKDTRRPAFQKMMRDVRNGKINLILVTDLSRLSRNILDFCILLDDLKKYSAKFLSIKEQFDTSTPVGELMVFNMISLAQFERKQTSERVSLNFHSRALRGLLNGGPVLLGFDKDPKNACVYVVNEEEAQSVRRIFEMYLEEGTITATIARLNDLGIQRKVATRKNYRLAKLGMWNRQALHRLLGNPAYVGMREINQRYKNHDQSELKGFQKYAVVKAAWPAIVKKELFDDVQNALSAAQSEERVRLANAERRVFFLSGILRCPECGAPFVGEAGHGRKAVYRYYVHKHYVGLELRCRVKRFSADRAEEKVVSHLNTFLQKEGYLAGVEEKIKSGMSDICVSMESELKRVQAELRKVEGEITGVFQLSNQMTEGPGLELVQAKLNDLGKQTASLKAKKLDAEQKLKGLTERLAIGDETRSKMLSFPSLWRKGTPIEQKRLLRTIFKHLLPTENSLRVFYWLNEPDDGSRTRQNAKRDLDNASKSLGDVVAFPRDSNGSNSGYCNEWGA